MRSVSMLPILALTLTATTLVVAGCSDQARSSEMASSETGSARLEPSRRQLTASDPELTRFSGRDPGLSPARAGGLHLAYVAVDTDARARVAYRRLPVEGPVLEETWVSPTALEIGAHGETPPVIVEMADGGLAIAYKVRLPGKWKGELRVQQSRDHGATWSNPQVLHDDTDNLGAHSFLDGEAVGTGAVFAWLDNRGGRQGMRVARLDADGNISPNETVDPLTCQCCATALLAERDQVWLAYRDLDDDIRDIALARSVSRAKDDADLDFVSLGIVADDGWQIQGCPHTGPRLAAGGDGALWVAWFSGAQPGVYVARSEDQGTSFSPRVALATPGPDGLQAVSHPELARLVDGRLAVFYEATRSAGRAIEIRIADPLGESWGDPLRFDEAGTYPRVAIQSETSFLAYTLSLEGAHQVVVVSIERLLAAAQEPVGRAVTSAAG